MPSDIVAPPPRYGKWKPATNLLGLDSGLAAVSSVVVAEGSVVDRITVVVSHEWLEEEGRVS